ncbi:MAG: 4-hydroxy-3-methylbut-2-enyl diphosphate reductase [Candidatus Cloacimonetes bacterium]|nr:4-hydroxy-3-methylbut-2-enyl diphosphate reductase [Candidatus Cloacimonadota bacterium]
MNIYLAEFSGFCFGVRRAIQLAEEAAGLGDKVCTMGELIHNPYIVNKLKQQGIIICDDFRNLSGHTVILRSHGVTREMLETLTSNGNKIVDATCPYVLRAQKLAKSMAEEDYQVMIMGDKNHPEVIAIQSWGGKGTQIVGADERPEPLPSSKICLIAQTTEKPQHLADLVAWLSTRVTELRVFNTICLATQQRQDASAQLAQKLPLVIVIGGHNSSNTRQLYQLCNQYSRCYHVAGEDELRREWFCGLTDVGLAAGASTPAETIVAVYNRIKDINGESDRVTSVGEIPLFKEESC